MFSIIERREKMDDKYLLNEAYKIALKSPDQSTQNGAILVRENGLILSRGYNHFPDGVKENEIRWAKPLKYQFVIHAEEDAICQAAKIGVATDGLIMVCGWAACSRCAVSIIQSGIKKLITHQYAYDRSPKSWMDEIKIAMEMFNEAGVEVVLFKGKIGAEPVRHSGEIWEP
jgi:dCMP deaminase